MSSLNWQPAELEWEKTLGQRMKNRKQNEIALVLLAIVSRCLKSLKNLFDTSSLDELIKRSD